MTASAAGLDKAPMVLVVGAASRDITTADPRGWRLGGAVTYGSLTLARLGLRVRALVGADDVAAVAHELDLLREAGVEVALAPLAHGPVFENIEQPGGRRQRCLSIADALEPGALPREWGASDAVFLGPVAGELGGTWASLRAPLVVLGWQGLLRRLVVDADVKRIAPGPDPLLDAADIVGVSVDDVDAATKLSELVDMIRPGATVVVTRGDRGGTVLISRRPARSALRAYPAIPSNGVVDATGAGDVFLATLAATAIDGSRLGATDWAARLTFAAAAGSLAVEGPGLLGVPTLAAIRRRVAEVA
ncbi:MAG TPA: PfkB family carbohydrate kinase [Patescibacteria group bacterium]|nr:PfkB family carbohydrate kinase [Patescibacteria group bacterium]